MSADRPLFPDAASWPSHTTVPGLAYRADHNADTERVFAQDMPTSAPRELLVRPLLHPALAHILPMPQTLVAQHFNRPGVNQVFGVAKLGKSRFMQQAVLSYLLGRPFLGQFAVQATEESVYLLLAEQGELEVQQSLLEQTRGLGLDAGAIMRLSRRLGGSPPNAYRLFDANGCPKDDFKALEQFIEEHHPAFLGLDTISDTLGYAPEGNADAMRNVYSSLRALAFTHKVCVVVVDHEGLPFQQRNGQLRATGRARGSSQKLAEVDVSIGISLAAEPGPNRRHYEVKVVSRGAPLRYRYEADYAGGSQRFTFLGYLGDGGRTLADRIVEYRANHPGASATQVARDLAVGKERVLKALKSLGLDSPVPEPVRETEPQTGADECEN